MKDKMMSRKTYSLLVFGSVFFAAIAGFAFLRTSIFGQSKPLAASAEMTARVSKKDNAALDENDSNLKARFGKAAAQNAQLKNNLKWSAGSKMQTGWYIYVPLIQHLIGTEQAPETEKFAAALAEWQRKSSLAPTGVLDGETMSRMAKWWQARRLNSSVYPETDEVLSAPITDFFDPTRSPELLKVRRDAYTAYKQMIAAAMADKSLKLKSDDKFLKIVSAFRSREYQDNLRRQSPNSGRMALAVNSPHFTGRALDIYVGGEPVSTRDDNRAIQVETLAYKWLVKNAEKFGFYPYYYEPWHWEYVPQNIDSGNSAAR